MTKLDLLARSVRDLMKIIQGFERKQVGLRILHLGMDTQTPTGKLLLTVFENIAQFERKMMLERQREGVAKAEIVKQVGVGEATVYRVLAKAKKS